jgi:hypothetical protein
MWSQSDIVINASFCKRQADRQLSTNLESSSTLAAMCYLLSLFPFLSISPFAIKLSELEYLTACPALSPILARLFYRIVRVVVVIVTALSF